MFSSSKFNTSNVRAIKPSDIPELTPILDDTGLFPSDLLSEMIDPYFSDPSCTDYWLTYELGSKPVALLFCEQERMTEATWNALALAVTPKLQSRGIGETLMSYLESDLKHREQTTLLVETSGLPEFERTRQFYDRIGFEREAIIRDFYAKGDDKVVFSKSLC